LLLFLISTIFVWGFYDVTWAETSAGVAITAAGNIDYDIETKSTTASQDVILKKDDIIIECQQLVYNGKTGVVQASGDVKITTGKIVYRTQTLNYNLNQDFGELVKFEGKLKGDSRDYYFSGNGGILAGETGTISKAVMTRCPKPKPDNVLTAKRIDYNGERVYLRRVWLKVKGIPVFFFPSLSFKTDDHDLPDVKLEYDNDDGVQVSFDYAGPVKDKRNWHYQGELSAKGTNKLGFGVKHYFGDHLSNRMNLAYDFDNFWVVDDQFIYDNGIINFKLDGLKEFSEEEETQLGIGLTRKYWETPVGRMQFGTLARRVYAFDSSKTEYGGFYWGYRLDFNPLKYAVLSYLRLDSNETNEDYRDFLEDFKLGDNFLYDISIPLSSKYSLIFDGNYNPDWNGNWVNRYYRIKYETCCFRVSAGWNDIDKSWEFSGRIKF